MENKITPELIEQAKKAESVTALLALAKENGIDLTAERAEKLFSEWHTTKELSDDELNSVSGGCGSSEPIACPACGSTDVDTLAKADPREPDVYQCRQRFCGHKWS